MLNRLKPGPLMLSLTLFLSNQMAYCQSVSTTTASNPRPGANSVVQNGTNLDLNSRRATSSPINLLGSGAAVNIKTGNSVQSVTSANMLTPAQMLAVYQVLSTGTQSIVLGAQGNALGGTFNIGSQFSNSLSNLRIPRGVTGISDFNDSSILNLSGNLVNQGKFYAVSSNPALAAANISAANIFNTQGALLTTILPQGGLAGYTNLNNNLSLNLSALSSITNSGTISSANNLSLTAGNSIVNALPAGLTGSSPSIQATNNLNLSAPSIVNEGVITSQLGNISAATASLTNSGSIAALNGSVAIQNLLSNELNVNNILGTISAKSKIDFSIVDSISAGNISIDNTKGTLEVLAGDINIGDGSTVEKLNFGLKGGQVLSNAVNVLAGSGNVIIAVGDLTGTVNIDAGTAHVLSATPNLKLGSINIVGDPTFFNTAGDVSLSKDITTNGNPLAIAASGDIISTSNGKSIDTSSSTGAGGTIMLIAGANIVPDKISAAGQVNDDSGISITIDGPSATGGKIDLTGGGKNNIAKFSSQSLAGGGDAGGRVEIVAFAGSNPGSGTVKFPSSVPIESSGDAGGDNGAVVIIAGAPSGDAIEIGGIDTTGAGLGNPGTGSIVVRTSTPDLQGGTLTIFDGTPDNFFSAGSTQASSIRVGELLTTQAPITLISGENVILSGDIITGGTDAGLGSLGIFAGGNIETLAGTKIAIDLSGSTAGGGDLMMLAGVTVSPGNGAQDELVVTGYSALGGTIDLRGGGLGDISMLSTSALGGSGGNGGLVRLFATQGPDSNHGNIRIPSAVTIETNGDGAALGGNVILLAGAPSGIAIDIGNIDSTGGFGPNVVSLATNTPNLKALPLEYSGGSEVSGDPALFSSPGAPSSAAIIVGDIAVTEAPIQINGGASVQVGNLSALGGGSFNFVSISAGTTLTTSKSIDVGVLNASSNSAGSISLFAESYLTPGPTGTLLSADGTGGVVGNGGTIFVGSSSASQAISIAAAKNGFRISAKGDPTINSDGGKLTLDAFSNLSVDASAIDVSAGLGGNGGELDFRAGFGGNGSILINGKLNVDGGLPGPSSGGSIFITLNSTTPFVIGTGVTTNGVTGLSANGTGGSISVTNNGTGGINLTTPGNIKAASPDGNGGNIDLRATNGVLESSAGVIDASGGNSFGSIISVLAKSFKLPTTGTLGLDVSGAPGSANSGGFINIVSTGSGKTAVNGGAVNIGNGGFELFLQGDAAGATDNGGVNVSSAANISVDPAFLHAATVKGGDGADLSFAAGTNVFINGGLNLNGDIANGGSGGSLSVTSISKTTFGIGPGSAINGINGAVSLDGENAGNITIISNAGGIAIQAKQLSTLATGASGSGAFVTLLGLNGSVVVGSDLNVDGAIAGGRISITSNSSSVFNVGNPGTSKPNGIAGKLSAKGEVGGSISIANSGTGGISIPTAGNLDLSASKGSGGDLILNATKGAVFVQGNLNVDGTAGFDGGTVSITSNSSKAFTIDPSALVNGLTGTISASGDNGGSISISNLGSGGIFQSQAAIADLSVKALNGDGGAFNFNAAKGTVLIQRPAGLDVSGSGTGNGGSITIVSNSSKAFSICPCTTTVPSGVVSLKADGAFGGFINITNLGSGGIVVGAPSSASISVAPTTGRGGIVSLTASAGVMAIEGGTISSVAGAIRLTAKSFVLTGSSSVILNVDGTGSKDGGSIAVYSTSSGKGFTVDSGIGQFDLSARGGPTGGNGGIISLSSGGNLIVNPIGLKVAPQLSGRGGIINLTAGTAGSGMVFVGSTMKADGLGTGNGGIINITSNSSKAFNLGAASLASANGVAGSLSASGSSGGSIGIKNLGGGIIISNPSFLTVSASGASSSAGTIDLEAPGNTLSIASGTLSVDNSNDDAGRIILNAGKIVVTGGILTLSAQGGGASGNGGTIKISQTKSAVPLSVGTNLVFDVSPGLGFGGEIDLISPSGVLVDGILGDTKAFVDISVTGKGTIKTTGAGLIRGEFLSLASETGDIGANNDPGQSTINVFNIIGPANLQTDAQNLIVSTKGANIFINNASAISIFSSSQGIKTSTSTKNPQLFVVATDGDILDANIIAPSSNLFLVPQPALDGSVSINGLVNASAINVFAIGNGTISVPGILAATSINLNAETGDIGDIFTPVNTVSSLLSVSGTNNNIFVSNNGSLQNLIVGGINTNFSLANNGSILISSVIPGGIAGNNISIATTQISNGSIRTNTDLSATGTLSLVAGGFGSIIPLNSTITFSGATIGLGSTFGNIGTVSAPIITKANSISAGTGAAGTVFIQNDSKALDIAGARAGGNLRISSTGSISSSANISSALGSVSLISANQSGNKVTIGSTTTVTAGGGALLIENDNSTDGQILIGAGAALIGAGSVTVSIGTPPSSGTNPAVPSNVTVTGLGQVFFGPQSIVDNTPQNLVDAVAIQSKVIFNNQSATADITLDGGVTVRAGAPVTLVSSLDLTNTAAVTALQGLQQSSGSGVTGTLVVTAGKVTGGNLIFAPSVNLASLSAINIPKNVTVEFAGFDSTRVVGVNLVGTSTSKTVTINGNLNFTSNASTRSSGLISISSSVTGSPVFNLGKTGIVQAANQLTIQAAGDSTIAGVLSSAGNIALLGVAGIPFGKTNSSGNGTVISTGSILGGLLPQNTITLSSSGIIQQTAGTILGSLITLQVFGLNTVLQSGAGKISAKSLFLNLGASATTLGTGKDALVTSAISVNTMPIGLANATIKNSGTTVILDNSNVGGQLNLTSDTGITIRGAVQCGSAKFTTSRLQFQDDGILPSSLSTIQGKGAVNVSSSGSSNLNVDLIPQFAFDQVNGISFISKGNLSIGAAFVGEASTTGNITMQGKSVTLQEASFLTTGNISVSAGSGGISVLSTSFPFTANQFVTSVRGNVALSSTGSINLGDLKVDSGNLTVLASGKISSFSEVDFNVTASGNTAVNAIGGGIDIGSGVSKSLISKAMLLTPGTRPVQSLGTAVIISQGFGAILTNVSGGGSISLNTNPFIGPTVTLNGGVMVFQSVGAKSSVNLSGGSFQTTGFAPIGFAERFVDNENEDFIVDCSEDAEAQDEGVPSIVQAER